MKILSIFPYEEFIVVAIIIFIIAIIIGAMAYQYKYQNKLNKKDNMKRLTPPNWMIIIFSLVLALATIGDILTVVLYYYLENPNPVVFYLVGFVCFIFILVSFIMLGQLLFSYVAYNDKILIIYKFLKRPNKYKYNELKYYQFSKEIGVKLYDKSKIIIYSADSFQLGLSDFVMILNQKRIKQIHK